ncbi:MAG TPA: hypothetical protein VFL98_01345 [Candidatus Paceibacterota bacterium]|nr:hypothetical protein [Candidatus Paceibacterota bacterium]
MNTITNQARVALVAILASFLSFSAVAVIMPASTEAVTYSDPVSCCTDYSTPSYYDTSYTTPSYSYSDYTTPSYSYSDYTTPSYDTTDYSTPSYSYTDYTTPSYSYTDYTTPSYDTTDYSTPSYSYTDYTTPSYTYTDNTTSDYETPSYTYSDYETPSYTYTTTPTYTYTTTPTYAYTTTPTYTYTYTPPQHTVQNGNPVTYQPTCSISANPNSATYGGSATLTWNSNYATSATLTDAGNVSTNGSYTLNNLTGTRTYTLTVYGNGGSNSCQTTIYVNQQQYQQPTCSLYADQTSISYGGSSTLHWTSANALSASLTDAGTVSTNGSYSFSNLTGSKTYTLTVYGYNGQTNTCQTTVSVNQQQYQQPYCSLSVNPNPIYNGNSATITWTTTNASSAYIDQGLGSVNVGSGSRTIYPGTSRTYTMTVYGYNGQSATCTGYANVQQNNYYPPTSNLYCSITSSQNYVTSGGASYLSWTSTGATSAWLSDGIGSVATNGSLIVHPSGTTHYVLTVSDGYGHTQTCSTDTYVNGTYVSLTQVPYTGFDFGPVGDTIYWFVLAGGALAAAYFLTMYRGGAVNFALSALGARSNHIVASEDETDEDGEAELPESVEAVIDDESDGEEGGNGDAMTLDTSSGMPRLVITRSKRPGTGLPGQN